MAHYPEDLLLGKNTPVVDEYSPQLLYPISRATGRAALTIGDARTLYGADLWHAYEVSWLDSAGKPQVRVGRFTVPADSPNMVESKSFKLYLNSLNNTRFAVEQELVAVIQRDIARAAGAEVDIELLPVGSPVLAGTLPEGACIDELDLSLIHI